MPNLETYTSPVLFEDEAYYIPQVLGNVFGLNTGYFIQELHWRLRGVRQGKGGTLDVNGRPWFFRSLNAYEREFSKIKGMSRSTIQRTIKFLTAEGILLKWEEANPKYWGGSRTWYSLNYQKLTALYFEYLKANPDPVVKGDLEPDLGDEIDDAGGMFNLNNPQGEGYVQPEHSSIFNLNIHTESSTESTKNRVDRAAGAAQSATPLEQKKQTPAGQSYLSQVQEDFDRSDEHKAGTPTDGDANLPYADLSMLGKFLVMLSNRGAQLPEDTGTKTLTAKQSAALATEISFFHDNGQHITISPDELFETDPLFKTWLERVVHPVLRQRAQHLKPIARDTLVSAVRLKQKDFNLKAFYKWREKAQYKDWKNIPSKEPARWNVAPQSIMPQLASLALEGGWPSWDDEDTTEEGEDTDGQQ